MAGITDFEGLIDKYHVGGIIYFASGRPKDLIEAEVLGALRDEIEGR